LSEPSKKITKVYDQVSVTYDPVFVDRSNIHSESTQVAFDQINQAMGHDQEEKFLDIGAGTGKFLKRLSEQYPHAKLYGSDISAGMLEKGKSLFGMQTIHSDCLSLHHHFPAEDFNLIITHFIYAYVNMTKVFSQADYLLKPGGLLSVITTTKDAFPKFRAHLENSKRLFNPLKILLKHTILYAMDHLHVPHNSEHVDALIHDSNFEIIEKKCLNIDIFFKDEEDAYDFLFRGGWAASFFDHKFLPHKIIDFLAKYGLSMMSYPFTDQCYVDVLLLRKK